MFELYTRSIDAGNGSQQVLLKDGKIVAQWLEANQGYYTGDGNPEFVGQMKSVLRGKGFKKERPSRTSSGAAEFQNSLWVTFERIVNGRDMNPYTGAVIS